MKRFVQTSLNSLLTWSFVSHGLKKMHSTGQICSENRKQALMEVASCSYHWGKWLEICN